MANQLESTPPPQPVSTPAGIRHFAVTALFLLASAMLSYAHPSLARFRPWVAGESAPVARMFVRDGDKPQLPGFAEAGLLATAAPQADLDRALGAAVAANLAPDVAKPVLENVPKPANRPARSRVRIKPEEYAGITQEIELPKALSRFFAKLEMSANKRRGAITRVAHYGDSSVAADAITRTARRLLQARFGDSGHGFILISRGDMHYGHHDIRHKSSDGWQVFSLVRDSLRRGLYGYGGVQARATSGEYAKFQTSKDGVVGRKASRFELFFQRHRRGAKVKVQVDRRRHSVINTRSAETEDDYLAIDVPDGPHTFKIRTSGGGVAHLYGAVLERSTPGIVYDSLGLVGARAERLLNAEGEHMAKQLRHRNADLLVLGFGGNEAGSRWLQLDRYEQELTQVVTTMRSAHEGMDCLLFGPLDQGQRSKRGAIITIPLLPKIVDVQRRVARAQGCAFFDTYQAMGGKNSIRRWYRSRPKLATSDLRHATPKGYEVVGKLYSKALLKSFADYLERK